MQRAWPPWSVFARPGGGDRDPRLGQQQRRAGELVGVRGADDGDLRRLFALGYWVANPIARTYAEINHGIDQRVKKIDAKRRACYRAAGRVETCEKELEMIEARSPLDQLAQLHLAAEEIDSRGGGNAHVYGPATDPEPIQDVIGSRATTSATSRCHRPGGSSDRIQEIRAASDTVREAEDVDREEATGVPVTEPFTIPISRA